MKDQDISKVIEIMTSEGSGSMYTNLSNEAEIYHRETFFHHPYRAMAIVTIDTKTNRRTYTVCVERNNTEVEFVFPYMAWTEEQYFQQSTIYEMHLERYEMAAVVEYMDASYEHASDYGSQADQRPIFSDILLKHI